MVIYFIININSNVMESYFNKKTDVWRVFKHALWLILVLFPGIFSSFAQTVTTIGTQVLQSGTTGISPYNYYWESRRVQFVYTAAEMTAAGMAAGNISAIAFDVSQVNAGNLLNYTIKMRHTTNTDAAAHDGGAFTTVKNAHTLVPGSTGWRTITFDTPFNWDGTSNVCVDVCWGVNTGWGSNGQVWLYNNVANQRRGVFSSSANQCAIATTATGNGKPRVQFTWSGGSPCTGTPAPGNTLTSAPSVCSGANFTLSLQNPPTGTGITYQWQSGPTNTGPWTDIPGATNATRIQTQTAATWYQCVVTCNNSGLSATSTPVQVNMGSACQCATYCSPTYSNGNTFGDYIQSVTLNPGALISNSTGPNPLTVTLYTSPNPTLNTGASYTLSVVVGTYSSNDVKAWADWNGNGVFEATEVLGQVYDIGSGATATFNFTVPGGATPGSTRIRVMEADQGTTDMQPCAALSFGETEDYCITIAVPPPCTGLPTPGNTTSSASNVCTGVSFDLGFSGTVTGTGITYQWQSGPTNTGPWTDIPGATNSTRTQTQTATTWYQCVVTCTNSGQTATSTPIQVIWDPPSACYCIPSYTSGTGFGDYIGLVNLGSINNTTTGNPTSPYFTYYNGMSTVVEQGAPYTLTLSPGTYPSGNVFAAWIDYNIDGTFQASEKLGEITINAAYPATGTISFTVPGAATIGTTRMRVREVYFGSSIDPCATYTYGETEDYDIIIQAPTPRTVGVIDAMQVTGPVNPGTNNNNLLRIGIPVTGSIGTQTLNTITVNYTGTNAADIAANGVTLWSGTALAPVTQVGVGQTLSGGNATFTVNQSLPAGTSYYWVRANTANNAAAGNVVDFRVQANQMAFTGAGGASPSGAHTKPASDLNPAGNRPIQLYCIPQYTNSGCANVYIANVQLNNLNRSSMCNGMPNNYEYIAPLGVGNTTTLDKGATYSMTVLVQNPFNNNAVGVWFDFNNDNDFDDAGEFFTDGLVIPGAHTFNITVPVVGATGYVRMRVRTNWNAAITSTQSCSTLTEGETEDYYVNITPATPRTLGTVTATQQLGDVGVGTTNNNLLRINLPVTGSTGTLTVTSLTVNYTGTASADIPANGVSLWTGTAAGPVTQIGTSQSLVANSATFSGLSAALNPATTYLWVRCDIAPAATIYNVADFSIPANGIVVASAGGAATYMGNALLNPAGSRTITLNYCTPVQNYASCSSIDYINSVAINTLNNVTGCNTAGLPGNSSFPASGSTTTILNPGVTYTLSVGLFSNTGSGNAGAWFDWNNNGVFTDPGEFFACSPGSTANVLGTATASVTVPINATPGPIRMRVRYNWNAAVTSGMSCGVIGFGLGETEDYTITISTPCTWLGNTTDWHTASNWSCNYVPTPNATVIIPDLANDPIVNGAAHARYLTIDAGAQITLNGASTLTVTQNWTGGTGTAANILGPGRVRMTSTTANISGRTNFNNLEIAAGSGNATIAAGVANTVNINRALMLASGNLNTNGNLTTKSTSVNTAAFIDNFSAGYTGTMTGNATIERFIHRTGFSYLGTPINNPQANEIGNNVGGVNGTGGNYSPLLIQPGCQFLAPGSPYSNFMRYNESIVTNCNLEGWEVITDGTSILENGRGYSINVPTAGTVIDATGAVNLGAVSYNGMSNTPTNTTTQKGLNMLSNPYPSPLNLDAFKAANPDVGGVAYVWNGGNMVSILMNDGTPSYVGLYQGFQVIWNGVVSGGVVNFANSMRWAWPTTLFYDEPNVEHKMDIVVTNANGDKDQTLIYFADGREDGWEIEHDGYKFNSAAGIPTLYTRIEGISDQVSVNALPLTTQTRKIPMGLRPGSSGNFTFDFQSLSTLPANMKVFLEDTKTGTMQNMRTNATYSFGMNETENPDRFFIHLMIDGNTAGTENTPAKGNISMWAADKTININFGHDIAGKVDVKIYDLAGKLIDVVEYQNVQKGMKEILSNRVVKGIYLVNIVGKDVNVSKKVFID
jgi:hypothetical protein